MAPADGVQRTPSAGTAAPGAAKTDGAAAVQRGAGQGQKDEGAAQSGEVEEVAEKRGDQLTQGGRIDTSDLRGAALAAGRLLGRRLSSPLDQKALGENNAAQPPL